MAVDMKTQDGEVFLEHGDTIVIAGISCKNLYMNSKLVLGEALSPNIVTATVELIVGVDIPSGKVLTICATGAGGAGCRDNNLFQTSGGGHAGGLISSLTVGPFTNGERKLIVIGEGGVSSSPTGAPGTATSGFGLTAAGGAGGVVGTNYAGDGASKSSCGGTSTDGKRLGSNGAEYGGESNGFGKGGDGPGLHDGTAEHGGTGAGGGAGSAGESGNGGRGEMRISWT